MDKQKQTLLRRRASIVTHTHTRERVGAERERKYIIKVVLDILIDY